MVDDAGCRLYLVTPEQLDPAAFADDLAAALDGGDAACVQLRLKDVDDDTIRRACDLLLPGAQSRNVAFILNDNPVLAAACGCDGVHIGQEDAPYAEARALVGDDAIVGVTCGESIDLGMSVGEAGADYVAFGAFFPSSTKPGRKHFPTPDLLARWSNMTTVPCVAIGGINEENCGPLVAAGADFLAVVSAVWSDPNGPGAGVAALNAAIAAARVASPEAS